MARSVHQFQQSLIPPSSSFYIQSVKAEILCPNFFLRCPTHSDVMSSSVSHALEKSLVTSFGVKILSFLISVLTVRFSSVSDFGKISVQYQLYVSLPLFLMKEGFRRAAIRESDPNVSKRITFIGVLVTIGLIASTTIGLIRWYNEDFSTISLISIGLLIEAFAEFFLIHQLVVFQNYASRTTAETWSSFFRSLFLLYFLYSSVSPGIAFGLAQIVYGLVWLILLARNLGIGSAVFNLSTKSLPWNSVVEMCLSSVQKLLLTEGERILAVSILSADEMGQLGLITNLGSIVLRLFFAPIEDIAFTGLARTKKFSVRVRIIQALFAVQFTVGLLGVLFGPFVAQHVIQILYGSTWSTRSEVVLLLQIYCVFLLTCSANGPLEAYYFAVTDSRKVRYAMISQAVAFGVFVLVVVITSQHYSLLGSIGIVIGNMVSMIVRILWSTTAFPSIQDFIHPKLRTVLIRVFSGAIVAWSATTAFPAIRNRMIVSLVVVGGIAVLTLASIIRTLRAMLADAKNV